MNNYINYHSHTSMSNISTPDSVISNRDRAIRASELKQTVLSGVEHGWMGKVIETIELSKEFNIKPLLGSEVYAVKNRFEKDKTNAHLILLAKNENGRKSINRLLSESNVSGFYYKARCDFELLFNLPKNDVWVTTACIAGFPWKYEDSENIIEQLLDHFENNLFLEVQNHHTDSQKILNKRIVELSNRYHIPLIAGMDSHMIYPNQAQERDDYLLSRGIEYPDEQNWFLDFPSYEEALQRFKDQGVLNDVKIEEALDNTNIFNDVKEYNSIVFNPDIIKLPTLYPNHKQEDKNKILETLVWSKWEQEKNNIFSSQHAYYEGEIRKELDTIFETNMADYFLLDYEVIKKGKEMGGQITLTGRGSAVSFYISKLLDFTTVDRIAASVKLFPERFISAERLLETKSLPDIDFNLGNPEVFVKAQEIIIGEGHSYPMIAFGTVKASGAWKLFSRISNIDFDTANDVSMQLQKYDMDLKHAESEEEKESLDVLDYIEPKYHNIFNESKKYLGLVNSLTPHPCATLLFNNGDIREEFGLIKIKTGNVEHICACCDGLFAENYKLLKNDLLKVNVVKLIYGVYERINLCPHTIPELLKVCENDKSVWDVYANGWTKGINQFEQTGTRGRATKYKPHNISELSAFVAAVRPGFKSNYDAFESRQAFEYGVKSLDELIQTKEFPYSFMIYQENAMQVMAYAGIPIAKTYEIIKNIAKKRVEKVKKYKDQFITGMKKKLVDDENLNAEEAKKVALMTWQIIDDSSRYSFNSAHAYSVAGDSLYGAYLKSHYPLEFYEVFLNILEEDGDKNRLSEVKIEAQEAYGIKFPSLKFGQDNRKIVANAATKEINQSMQILKGFGNTVGEKFYNLSLDFLGNDFLELLVYAEESGYMSAKWDKLIKINYFDKFGSNGKLYEIYKEFTDGENKYQKTYVEKTKIKRLETLKEIWNNLPNKKIPFNQQLKNEFEILGTIQSIYPELNKKYKEEKFPTKYYYIKDLNLTYAPRLECYNLAKGTQGSIKMYKATYNNKPFSVGAIIKLKQGWYEEKPNTKPNINNVFVPDGTGTHYIISKFELVTPEELDKILEEKTNA